MARRRFLPWMAVVATLFAARACKGPTQISIEITTDFACDRFQGATITVGALGAGGIEDRPPVAIADRCDPATGRVGSLVVVPSGAKDDPIAIKVVGGRDKRAEDCAAPGYGPGCIVARRALRFVPHADLEIPIVLRASCNGVTCPVEETCVKGTCVPATIVDPSQCINACDESALVSADGGDAGTPPVPEASPADDTSVADATAEDTSPPPDTTPPPVLCPADPALVMCYAFDGVVKDEAPNAVPASAVNGVVFEDGRSGQAARFTPATPSYISVPSDPRWNASAFTIEAWLWPAAYPTTGRGGLVDCGDRGGAFLESDQRVHCHATSLNVATNVVPLGAWTHVACVVDTAAGTITAYQDGAFVATGPSGSLVAADTTIIGADAPVPNVDFLDGRIDELRVWSTARSAADIAAAAKL